MNLVPRAIILLAIHAYGGQIAGKTLLQKRLYFTEVLLGRSLGLDFDAHYYGPYSATVNSELVTLKIQNQLREEVSSCGYSAVTGFEKRLHHFELTASGKAGVAWLERHYADECKQLMEAASLVTKAGELDYMDLSFAAKAHWILCRSKRALDRCEIAANAPRFGWQVKEDQICRGVVFLSNAGLVKELEPAGA